LIAFLKVGFAMPCLQMAMMRPPECERIKSERQEMTISARYQRRSRQTIELSGEICKRCLYEDLLHVERLYGVELMRWPFGP
jgi:hypothetical protein